VHVIDRLALREKRLQYLLHYIRVIKSKLTMTYMIADVEAIMAKAKGRPKMFAGLLDSEMGARPFCTSHHVPQELKIIPSCTLPLASDDHPSNSTFHWVEGWSHHLRFAPPPPPCRPSSKKTKNKTKNIVLLPIVLAALLAAATATVYLLMPGMYVNDYYVLLSTPLSFFIKFSAGFSPFGGSSPVLIANSTVSQSSSLSLLSTPSSFFIFSSHQVYLHLAEAVRP
jgi:hypothetical protein